MSVSHFDHVQIVGIESVVPEEFIDIDSEIEFFGGSEKRLARAKKMIGYGRRYIADEKTTVSDLAICAAQRLMKELNLSSDEIDLLIFVNQKPDYPEPSDACIAHGVLSLRKSCPALHLNHGCAGYVYALWVAHSMIASGAVKNCLLLAGDLCARTTDQTNRKVAQVFGDSASATFLRYTSETRKSTFVVGCDGSGWDKIIRPFGGTRLPLDSQTVNLKIRDANGTARFVREGLMQGEDVFRFTMDIAPKLIQDVLFEASWTIGDVDLFAIHQANKQIVENIVERAGIPFEKAPTNVFSKYANTSANSVVTVLCDQTKDVRMQNVILCAFGIGLSWAGAALNISGMYNGGISTYITPKDKLSRKEQVEYWIKRFEKGE